MGGVRGEEEGRAPGGWDVGSAPELKDIWDEFDDVTMESAVEVIIGLGNGGIGRE